MARISCSIYLALLGVLPAFGQEKDRVPVSIPAYTVEGVGQPIDPNQSGAIVQSGGETHFLPNAEDTSLWKESKSSNGSGKGLVLRDGRWSQALIKLDLQALTAKTPIETASYGFKVGGVERPGNATFECHRMLVDWHENATWYQAFPDQSETWNGLKAGRDFEAASFAKIEVAELKRGQLIRIPGFEHAVQAWADGSWKNQGFVLTLSGHALQTSVPSREAASNPHDFLMGGASHAQVIARFDPALVARVLLRDDDLLDATLRIRLANRKQAPAAAIVRVLSATDHRELASSPVAKTSPEGWLEFPGLAAVLKQQGSIVIEASLPLHLYAMADEKSRPHLDLQIKSYPKATLFDHEVKPLPNTYTRVVDGHLSYGGKRLRLWGMVGYGEVDRLRKMGFNAQRVWDPALTKIFNAKGLSPEYIKRGELPPTTKGDGSNIDNADKHFADLKEHGMFVMFAALTDTMPLKPLLADDSFIAGGPGWAEWKAAVAALKDDGDLKRLAVYFDERIQAVRFKSAEALLHHLNPYTGKRYAEEENIVLYEVWNENGGVYRFLNDAKKLPPYFEHEARTQWIAWLKHKYQDEAGVIKAWGKLGDGESFAELKLAPSVAEAASYPEQRARDYSEFLYDTVVRFDKRFRDHCRSLAASGVGVNAVPFSFDTQYRPSMPWLQVDAQGDVNCPGMYFWGLKSSLSTPPSAYVIDNHTVDNMPTVLYETNQARPNPSRTEYPLKLAALASWQDWDGIFWHYWAAADLAHDEEYLAGAMPQLAATHYWTGVQHERDPVMTSAMALAGRIFLNGEIHPAPSPSLYHVGRQGMTGLSHANGIGMGQATFERGAKIRFEPNQNSNLTIERPAPDGVINEAVKSGEEVLWDWPNARLIIDTPSVKAYVGKVSSEPYVFKDGTTLSGLSTPWICWALASADGKPLAETQDAFVTAVSDARNTDFDFDWHVAGGPADQAKAIRNRGRAPVIVAKVSYTLSLPTRSDYHFAGYDFALRKVEEKSAAQTNVLRVQGQTLWMGQIHFDHHGAAASRVVDANTGAQHEEASYSATVVASDSKLTTIWNPIPNLHWGDRYAQTYQVLHGAKARYRSLSSEEKGGAPEQTIHWSEAEVLFGMPANVDVSFRNGAMTRVTATFTRPPALQEVAAAYEKLFGPALEKSFKRQEEQSVAHWEVKQPAGILDIKVTEAQGTQVIAYELK